MLIIIRIVYIRRVFTVRFHSVQLRPAIRKYNYNNLSRNAMFVFARTCVNFMQRDSLSHISCEQRLRHEKNGRFYIYTFHMMSFDDKIQFD